MIEKPVLEVHPFQSYYKSLEIHILLPCLLRSIEVLQQQKYSPTLRPSAHSGLGSSSSASLHVRQCRVVSPPPKKTRNRPKKHLRKIKSIMRAHSSLEYVFKTGFLVDLRAHV